MNHDSVLAKIKTKFDLGYIVELEDGGEAQLSVLKQRGKAFEHHIEGKEELLYGETIPVYVIYRDERYCSASQFSPSERAAREEIEQQKAKARERCEIGQVYVMEITKDYGWGYLCMQIDGYLSGVIKKPMQSLEVGQHIRAIVVGKNKNAVLLEVQSESNNA